MANCYFHPCYQPLEEFDHLQQLHREESFHFPCLYHRLIVHMNGQTCSKSSPFPRLSYFDKQLWYSLNKECKISHVSKPKHLVITLYLNLIHLHHFGWRGSLYIHSHIRIDNHCWLLHAQGILRMQMKEAISFLQSS